MPKDADRKKLDPKLVMGVCTGLGYLAVTGVKVYAFGWDDVPAYWVWAGAGVIVVMVGFGLLARARERRDLKRAIERSAIRSARRPSINASDEQSATD